MSMRQEQFGCLSVYYGLKFKQQLKLKTNELVLGNKAAGFLRLPPPEAVLEIRDVVLRLVS